MPDSRAAAGAETFRLEVRRVINRPAAEVFQAWIDQKALESWFAWRARLDPKVGGRFHIDMHYHGKVHAHDGEYLEIDPPRRLKFTWISESTAQQRSIVTIDFLPKGAGTEVVLVQEGLPSEQSREKHNEGWTSILEQIGKGAQHEILQLVVKRTLPSPIKDVWAAWTKADAIAQWMAMPGCEEVKVQCDLKEGGKLIIDMVVGGKPWREDGTFIEVVSNRRLRFTWITPESPWELNSTVVVEFAEQGASTDVTLTHTGFPNQKERDSHDAGWQQIIGAIIAASKAGLTVATLARAALELQRAQRA